MSNSEQSISASDGGIINKVTQTIINNPENVYLHESTNEVKLSVEEIAKARERYCQGMINRYGNLEFLGVLTRREEGNLPLDKIFVELKAKRQAERGKLPRDWYRYGSVSEAVQQAEARTSSESPQATQEILSNHSKVVLIGQPGSGKSTLLKYLAITTAQDSQDDPIPLFIPMADYVKRCGENSGQNLLDYLETFVCEKYLYLDPPLTKDFFLHQLRGGALFGSF